MMFNSNVTRMSKDFTMELVINLERVNETLPRKDVVMLYNFAMANNLTVYDTSKEFICVSTDGIYIINKEKLYD